MKTITNFYQKAILMLSLVLTGYVSQAQTTIFFEKMGTVTGTTAVAAHETANGFDNDNLTMTVAGYAVANASDVRKASSKGTDGANDANIYFTANNSVDRYFAIEDIDASGFTNLTLDFFYRKEVASTLPALELAYWDGTAYVNVPYTFAEANNAAVNWYSVTGIQLPAAAQINGLKLRWKRPATSDPVRLDEVSLAVRRLLPTRQLLCLH